MRALLLVVGALVLWSGGAAQSAVTPARVMPLNPIPGVVFGSLDELQIQFFRPEPARTWRLDDTRTLSLFEWDAVVHTWRMLVLTEVTEEGERLSYVGLPSNGRVMSCSCGDTITLLSLEQLEGELLRLDLEREFSHPRMYPDIEACRRASCVTRIEEIWSFVFDVSGPLACLACRIPVHYKSYLSVHEAGATHEMEVVESGLLVELEGTAVA